MKVNAPGKLILSGEHSVVYGHPALAIAVNRYVSAIAVPQGLPLITFDLSNLAYENSLTIKTLKKLKSRILHKYQRFISGDFTIREVLRQPVELAQFAFTLFLETLNVTLNGGLKICLQSDIPVGCGMGSSAATVLSIVHVMAHHFRMEFSPELFFKMGLEAENMQHGYSSGLDLRVSMQGGCILLKDGEVQPRSIPAFSLYLINTGTPLSNTGQCVEKVAPYFKKTSIGDEFAMVTEAMEKALQTNQLKDVMLAVRENHRLLVKIGVVPLRVQEFIKQVEALGGVGKICGAGAISGEQGGMMLVMMDDDALLTALCAQFNYSILPLQAETRGVHVA